MRQAEISRNTLETQITVRLNLDGDGRCRCATGVPFLDHMLDQIARHGLIDLDIEAHGDLEVDEHHTIEDVAITLGEALYKALRPNASPRFETISKVCAALGVRLVAQPIHAHP